jgi:hypothetical protein
MSTLFFILQAFCAMLQHIASHREKTRKSLDDEEQQLRTTKDREAFAKKEVKNAKKNLQFAKKQYKCFMSQQCDDAHGTLFKEHVNFYYRRWIAGDFDEDFVEDYSIDMSSVYKEMCKSCDCTTETDASIKCDDMIREFKSVFRHFVSTKDYLDYIYAGNLIRALPEKRRDLVKPTDVRLAKLLEERSIEMWSFQVDMINREIAKLRPSMKERYWEVYVDDFNTKYKIDCDIYDDFDGCC